MSRLEAEVSVPSVDTPPPALRAATSPYRGGMRPTAAGKEIEWTVATSCTVQHSTYPMAIRLLLTLACLFALTSCSYGYNIKAVVLNGRLAFIVDPRSWRHPSCVGSVHVETEETREAHAKPAAGDDAQMVARGTIWWKDFANDTCPNSFPIFYGQALRGTPFAYEGRLAPTVEAKPLKIGVVYEVGMVSDGSGYGSGRFRLRADRTVENLPPTTFDGAVGNSH